MGLKRAALLIIPFSAGCGDVEAEKIYSRSGTIVVESPDELQSAVQSISDALGAPIHDRQDDRDGLPMFLLSNKDVMISVMPKVGADCDWSAACSWKYSISATDLDRDVRTQRQMVDAAVTRLKN